MHTPLALVWGLHECTACARTSAGRTTTTSPLISRLPAFTALSQANAVLCSPCRTARLVEPPPAAPQATLVSVGVGLGEWGGWVCGWECVWGVGWGVGGVQLSCWWGWRWGWRWVGRGTAVGMLRLQARCCHLALTFALALRRLRQVLARIAASQPSPAAGATRIERCMHSAAALGRELHRRRAARCRDFMCQSCLRGGAAVPGPGPHAAPGLTGTARRCRQPAHSSRVELLAGAR